MAYCCECGNQLRENAKFCNVCGASQMQTPAANMTSQTESAPQQVSAIQTDNVSAGVPASQPAVPVRKWKAIVSFVTGLVSILSPCLCCIHPLAMGIVGLICGIVALVFAILSRKDTGGHFSGMAIAGLILSIFGIFISLVVVTFAVIFMIAEPYMPDFDNYWDTYYWIYDTFGEEAASFYERIMDTTSAGDHTRI